MSEAVGAPALPWAAQSFRPFDRAPGVVFARAAARSALFAGIGGGDGVVVGSAAGADARDTATRARGELIERMGNIVAGRRAEADRVVVSAYRGLGRAALDPALLARHIPAEEARDAVRLWVVGRSLCTGREVLVPAGAVYLRHRPPVGCAAAGATAGSTGVAAHLDEARAAAHAVWEILERDLVRRSWYAETAAPAREVAPPPAAGLRESLARLGLETTVLLLPAPAGAACVVVAVHGPDRTGQAFGARCGPAGDVPVLAEKATYEALMVRWSVDLPVARQTWARWGGAGPPRTALEHALWAYHRQDGLGLWLTEPCGPSGPSGPATVLPAPPRPATDPSSVLAAHTGHDVIAVPTPSPQAAESGLHVVRVVAPGAHALPNRAPEPTGSTRSGQPHPFG